MYALLYAWLQNEKVCYRVNGSDHDDAPPWGLTKCNPLQHDTIYIAIYIIKLILGNDAKRWYTGLASDDWSADHRAGGALDTMYSVQKIG